MKALLLVLTTIACAQTPRAADNPVRHEMRLLTETLRDTIQAIADGDVRPVAEDLHRVHLAKEATSAAIASGSYRPPKNPALIDQFHALDEAFHEKLALMVAASRKNDVPAMATALGATLASCQGCHAQFR